MKEILHRIGGCLRISVRWLLASLLGLIVVLVFTQVISRYITHTGTHQMAEFCRILMIWTVFLGVPLLISEKRLIVIDVAHLYLGDKASNQLSFLIDLLTLAFLGALAFYAVQLNEIVSIKIAPATGLSYRWFYTPPIICSLLGTFFILERLVGGAVSSTLRPSGDTQTTSMEGRAK